MIISTIVYVKAFKPLLWKLSEILRHPDCAKSVTTYADDITIIVTETDSLRTLGKAIQNQQTKAE